MPRRKLLLADDSITIQKVVNLTFADEGVDVVAVADGDAALAELAANTPDILLADVNMPGPTGYEICEQVRANTSTQNLPVILLVGSFEPFDEVEASRVGANAYLTKPFQSIKQLIAQVNELIEAANPQTAEAVTEADVSAPIAVEEPALEGSALASPAQGPLSEHSEEMATESEETTPRYFDDLGYETSVRPEPASEPQPADDIDSLYQDSLSGAQSDLSDVGIDDEIIETSYAAESTNDLADFTAEVQADSGTYEPGSTPAEVPADSVPEALEKESPVSFVSEHEQRFPEDPSNFENTISYENWRPADMRTEERVSTEVLPSLETTKLDESYTYAAEQPQPTRAVGEDTIRMENRFDTTGSASFQFDDINLLDLSNSTEEPVEITTPANAVEQGSNKQVVTLAPELIEMIAQRVVEKLSEKY